MDLNQQQQIKYEPSLLSKKFDRRTTNLIPQFNFFLRNLKWANSVLHTKHLPCLLPYFIQFSNWGTNTCSLLIIFFFISKRKQDLHEEIHIHICFMKSSWSLCLRQYLKMWNTLILLSLLMVYKFKFSHNKHICGFPFCPIVAFRFVHIDVMYCCCSQIPSMDQWSLCTMLQYVQEKHHWKYCYKIVSDTYYLSYSFSTAFTEVSGATL